MPGKPNYHIYNAYFNANPAPIVPFGNNEFVMTANDNTNGYFTFIRSKINGEELVHKTMAMTSSSGSYCIAVSGNSSIFALTSIIKDWTTQKYDLILLKLTENGDTVWTKTYGGPLGEISRTMKKTNDGGVIACGYIQQAGGSGINDFFAWKLDADGNTQWYKNFYTNSSAYVTDVTEMENGDFVLVGPSNAGSTFVLKINAAGAEIKKNTIISNNFIQTNGICATKDGKLICVGGGTGDIAIIKLDANLKAMWSKSLGYSEQSEFAYSVVSNGDDTYTVAGTSTGPKSSGNQDILVAKFNAEGGGIWYRSFGGKSADAAYGVIKTQDNLNMVVGNTSSFNSSFATQIFTVLLDNSGDFK